jgi:hypothetical protein
MPQIIRFLLKKNLLLAEVQQPKSNEKNSSPKVKMMEMTSRYFSNRKFCALIYLA